MLFSIILYERAMFPSLRLHQRWLSQRHRRWRLSRQAVIAKIEIEMYSTRLQPLSSLLETSPGRFFSLKKIRDEMQGMENVFLCIITALLLNISICVCIVPDVFTEELYRDLVCSSTLILLHTSASAVKARNDRISAGKAVWFSFHDDSSSICYAKSTLLRKMRKLKGIVEWQVNERPRASSSGIWTLETGLFTLCVCVYLR